MKTKNQKINNGGFAALVVVLIVGAATLLMAFNSALLGIGDMDMGFSLERGNKALYFADGCVDESLRRLRLSSSFTGGSINLTDVSCDITITPSGNNRTITVLASTTDSYYKEIEVDVTLSNDSLPVITFNSWEEKTD